MLCTVGLRIKGNKSFYLLFLSIDMLYTVGLRKKGKKSFYL